MDALGELKPAVFPKIIDWVALKFGPATGVVVYMVVPDAVIGPLPPPVEGAHDADVAHDAVPDKDPVIGLVTTKEPDIVTFCAPPTLNTSILPDVTVKMSVVAVPVSDISSKTPLLPDTTNIRDPLPLTRSTFEDPVSRVLPVTSNLPKLPVSV